MKLGEQNKESRGASKTFPTMPSKQTEAIPDITKISDSRSSRAEETPTTTDIDPELTVRAKIKYNKGNETEQTEIPQDNQTPAISSPVDCNTDLIQRRIAKNADTTPTGSLQKVSTSVNKGIVDFNIEKGGGRYRNNRGGKGQIGRSNRLETAKKSGKNGRNRIFLINSGPFRTRVDESEANHPLHS